MGSWSPKSKRFFSISQQYRCTSLVKIHPFILEIGCRQAIFQQSEPSCDLENGVKVTKSNQFFSMSQQYRCTSLVKIHPFIQEIGFRQALKMGSRSPKSNQFFYMSQQSRCAGMVKIYLFLQEIGCRKAIFQYFPTICDLENGVEVIKI